MNQKYGSFLNVGGYIAHRYCCFTFAQHFKVKCDFPA